MDVPLHVEHRYRKLKQHPSGQFADDTTIGSYSNNDDVAIKMLQKSADELQQWKMVINVDELSLGGEQNKNERFLPNVNDILSVSIMEKGIKALRSHRNTCQCDVEESLWAKLQPLLGKASQLYPKNKLNSHFTNPNVRVNQL